MTTPWTFRGWQLSRHSRWGVYLVLFSVAMLTRLACFTGLIDSDDLGYSYFAQLASHGSYAVLGNHLGLRVGVTMPTGLIYSIFGAGEFTTVLLPLCASSACVPLVVAVGLKLAAPRGALIAGLLMLSFPVHVRYASVLVPETVVDFWILVAALVYLRARSSDQLIVGLGAGILFGIGYLTKEIALFVAAGFLLDALLQRRWSLFASVASGLALVGAAEVFAYAMVTGDPLYRPHVVQSSQLLYFADQMEAARSSWRLFKEYPREMLLPNADMGLHSLATLLLCAVAIFRENPSARRLLLLWAAVPFLYLNFGSASMSTYLPVAAGPRYVAVVYAPLFLLAGTTLDPWMDAPRWRWWVASAFLVVVAVDLWCAYVTRSTGYHTEELGSLRSIARHEALTGDVATAFVGPRAPEWLFSLRLLGNHSTMATTCLSVGPDAAQLPHVTGFVTCPSVGAFADRPLTYPLQ